MKLHYTVVNTEQAGFPRHLIPAVFLEAWAPAGHHIDMPRTHERFGVTNGGSVDSPEADLLTILRKLEKLTLPPTIREGALVMIDAEWSLPTTAAGRGLLEQIASHIQNHILPDAQVGLYGWTPQTWEVPCAFIDAYAGKPVQYIGEERGDYWGFGEQIRTASDVVNKLKAAGDKAIRRVMVLNPYPYGSHTDTVLRADYIAFMLDAAKYSHCCTDVLVWISRPKNDWNEDCKVIRFLEDLAELAGRGNA